MVGSAHAQLIGGQARTAPLSNMSQTIGVKMGLRWVKNHVLSNQFQRNSNITLVEWCIAHPGESRSKFFWVNPYQKWLLSSKLLGAALHFQNNFPKFTAVRENDCKLE